MKSVLEQSYGDWTHVIVNDGGDPAPVDQLIAEMAAAYRGRVHLIHNSRSLGMEAASNIGLRESDSRLVTLLDDDDSWHPEFLTACVQALENRKFPSIRGVTTRAIRVIEKIESSQQGDIVTELRREKFNDDLTTIRLSELLSGNLFTINSFMYERDVIPTIGLYREDLPVLGDWEFNVRFVSKFDIDVIPLPLSYFHHRESPKAVAMANTVIAGKRDHYFYATMIRNELLRRDLVEGRVGVGTLMNLSAELKDIRLQLRQVRTRTVSGILVEAFRRLKNRMR